MPEITLPTATWHPNPLDPVDGRALCYAPFLPNETIAEYVLRQGWDDALDCPANAFVGGVKVDKAYWLSVKPKPGVQISVHAALSGDDSDMGRVLMSIAVALVAFYVGGLFAVGGEFGLASAAASATVSIGGMLLTNALFPLPDPTKDAGKEDPTYTISAATNSMRHYEPLSLIAGRLRVFPDIDEKPFTFFRDNDQFLHQTFNFGLGDISLSDHKIGESTLESLNVTDVEVGSKTITDVDTAEGSELKFETGWVQRGGPRNTTSIEIDIAAMLASYNSNGDIKNETATFEFQYAPIGTGAWQNFTLPPVTVGYTPTAYEKIPANIDPETGIPRTPQPGPEWELWNSNTGEDSGDW